MKNNYEIKQHYIVQLENEQLRERIKELVTQFNELKKKYEDKEREGMVQREGINSIIEER
jgi:regulator of replication initiation timing